MNNATRWSSFQTFQTPDDLTRVVTDIAKDELARGHGFPDQLNECLGRMHRTEQQAFWRAIRNAMEQYGKAGCDMRNEGAVEFCRQSAANAPYMPYI